MISRIRRPSRSVRSMRHLIRIAAAGDQGEAHRHAYPTVLSFDYAAHLAGMWVVLAGATAIGVAIVLLVDARRDGRRRGDLALRSVSRCSHSAER